MLQLAPRVFSGLMACLFVVSAGLQLNDPDPVVWIALYLAGAAIAVAHAMQKKARLPATMLAGIALLWAASLVPDFWGRVNIPDLVQGMKAGRPEIEEAREAGGLLIVFLSMLVVALTSRKHTGAPPTLPGNA